MQFARRLVGVLWRWHRRTGLAILVFVLLLSTTGIALNHTSELDLDSRFVDSPWLLSLYGDNSHELSAYPLAAGWLARTVSGGLYLDGVFVGDCRGDLVGAAQWMQMLVAACAEEVLLLTQEGELIESIDASAGLPVPLAALGKSEQAIALMTTAGWRLADFDHLAFDASPETGAAISQLAPGPLPEAIYAKIPRAQQWLTWERLLLDLHSGRILGKAGVWFLDLVAVLLACIALSGLTMWAFHRRRARRK